jgi:hypothetical protein
MSVSLPEAAQLWLGIYGVDGRLAHMCESGETLEPGVASWEWQLSNGGDSRVATGVYFVRLKARFADSGRSLMRARVVIVK